MKPVEAFVAPSVHLDEFERARGVAQAALGLTLLGIPVIISDAVPRDEVWLGNADGSRVVLKVTE